MLLPCCIRYTRSRALSQYILVMIHHQPPPLTSIYHAVFFLSALSVVIVPCTQRTILIVIIISHEARNTRLRIHRGHTHAYTTTAHTTRSVQCFRTQQPCCTSLRALRQKKIILPKKTGMQESRHMHTECGTTVRLPHCTKQSGVVLLIRRSSTLHFTQPVRAKNTTDRLFPNNCPLLLPPAPEASSSP